MIDGKVGQGSYGIVYKAYKRKNLDKFYAIKCVNKQKVNLINCNTFYLIY